jgi:hypothetical protein
MTAQKLYGTLKFLDALDTKLRLQTSLESIGDALNNLVSSPAHPQHQSALANALATFTAAATKLSESISASTRALIAELGGAEFFDPSMAEKVNGSISSNAMTPSVASDFVQDYVTRRAAFLATVKSTLQGLQKLGISEAGLPPGSADLAFLIPRDLFKNHLAAFAKELTFISHLIRDFSEATTGHAESAELQELSSSVPTVALAASGAVILAIAEIVSKFLDAWKKIEEIREIRGRLTKIGLKGAAVEELTEQITTTVNEVIEESTDLVIVNYTGEPGRKNELKNALRQDMGRLFGQIERGLKIEFRAEPKGGGDEGNEKALESLSNLSREIQFPQIANEPMLLASGEILEGPIEGIKVSKKTATHKTTTKKETHKETKQETKQEP